MSEVTDILAQAKLYANSLKDQAVTAVSSLIDKLDPPGGGASPIPAPTNPLDFTPTPNEPITFAPATFNAPDKPKEPPGLLALSEVIPGDKPKNNVKKPTISTASKPSALQPFSAPRPSIKTDFALPPTPNYLKPPEPRFTDHVVPDKPAINIPSFTARPPGGADIPAFGADIQSTISTNQLGASLSFVRAIEGDVDVFIDKFGPDIKGQMQAMSSKLEAYLAGGTGLDTTVENAIYERAKGKNDAESRRVRDTTLADMAARGFTLPTGAMTSALQYARQSAADSNARAASEIVVMQAELEQKNLQFAMNTLVGLRTLIVNATIAYFQNLIALNGQSLEYAKAVLSGLIEAYNLGVKRFELLTEVFKSEIALYDVQAKAATLNLELYRGELSALEAEVNIDNSKVAFYKSLIEASTLEISAYKAHAESIVNVASLEKLKLELASLEVQTFGMEVQAKEAEWRGFAAEMQGEELKARLYATEVEALKGEIAAFQADIQAQVEVVRAQALTNQAMGENAKTSVAIYSALVQGETQKTSAEMENEKNKLAASVEKIRTNLAIDEFRLKHEIARQGYIMDTIKLQQQRDIAEAQAKTTHMGVIAQVGSISAQTLSGMAQAAMSGMNVLAAQTETI